MKLDTSFQNTVFTISLERPFYDHYGLDCSPTRGRKAQVQTLRGWGRSGFSPVLPMTCLGSRLGHVQLRTYPHLVFRSDCGLFSSDFHAAVGPDCPAVTNPDF